MKLSLWTLPAFLTLVFGPPPAAFAQEKLVYNAQEKSCTSVIEGLELYDEQLPPCVPDNVVVDSRNQAFQETTYGYHIRLSQDPTSQVRVEVRRGETVVHLTLVELRSIVEWVANDEDRLRLYGLLCARSENAVKNSVTNADGVEVIELLVGDEQKVVKIELPVETLNSALLLALATTSKTHKIEPAWNETSTVPYREDHHDHRHYDSPLNNDSPFCSHCGHLTMNTRNGEKCLVCPPSNNYDSGPCDIYYGSDDEELPVEETVERSESCILPSLDGDILSRDDQQKLFRVPGLPVPLETKPMNRRSGYSRTNPNFSQWLDAIDEEVYGCLPPPIDGVNMRGVQTLDTPTVEPPQLPETENAKLQEKGWVRPSDYDCVRPSHSGAANIVKLGTPFRSATADIAKLGTHSALYSLATTTVLEKQAPICILIDRPIEWVGDGHGHYYPKLDH